MNKFESNKQENKEGKYFYGDESTIYKNIKRKYGYSKKGNRCFGTFNHFNKTKVNVMATLTIDKTVVDNISNFKSKIKSPDGLSINFRGKKEIRCIHTFTDNCNAKRFEYYVEHILLPEMDPGDTFIIDNASYHKSQKIQYLINSKGCRILYLPPYSPDLNPIENTWALLKSKLAKMDITLYNLDEFEKIIIETLKTIYK